MPIRRSYSGVAPATVLTGDLASGGASFTVLNGTGYPDGSIGPFFVLVDRGLPSEEKILCTSRSENTFTVASRGQDGTVASAHNSQATVEHTVTAFDLDEMNAHTSDAAIDPHPQYVSTEELSAAIDAIPSDAVVKTIRVPHTFTISGDVAVPSGDTSYIPPFFVPVPAGQTVAIAQHRARINSGTSATVRLWRNGVALDSPIIVSTTATTITPASPATFSNGDQLALVVSAVSGSPKNLSFTVYLDYEV